MFAKKSKSEWKTRSGSRGHMRKNAYHRNLKLMFEDLLRCYCYATKTNRRTIR